MRNSGCNRLDADKCCEWQYTLEQLDWCFKSDEAEDEGCVKEKR